MWFAVNCEDVEQGQGDDQNRNGDDAANGTPQPEPEYQRYEDQERVYRNVASDEGGRCELGLKHVERQKDRRRRQNHQVVKGHDARDKQPRSYGHRPDVEHEIKQGRDHGPDERPRQVDQQERPAQGRAKAGIYTGNREKIAGHQPLGIGKTAEKVGGIVRGADP